MSYQQVDSRKVDEAPSQAIDKTPYHKWYYENNKALCLERNRKYVSENRAHVNQVKRFHNAERRKGIKQATPSWADKTALKQIYLDCPAGYHVDHVIPLRGKLVSGLHVPENLQYLPAKENRMKKNKYEV